MQNTNVDSPNCLLSPTSRVQVTKGTQSDATMHDASKQYLLFDGAGEPNGKMIFFPFGRDCAYPFS